MYEALSAMHNQIEETNNISNLTPFIITSALLKTDRYWAETYDIKIIVQSI
jgi:hypothetical protein